MNALPKVSPIAARPLRRPTYVPELSSLAAFTEANRVALTGWFNELRAVDPEDFCDFEEFCGGQYDREIEEQRPARGPQLRRYAPHPEVDWPQDGRSLDAIESDMFGKPAFGPLD